MNSRLNLTATARPSSPRSLVAGYNKIKILFTSPSADMGGAEKSLWHLSSKLRMDDRFEIYGAFPKGNIFDKLRRNFKHIQKLFFIEFIPKAKSLWALARWPLYLITLKVNFLLCIKEILFNHIDIVCVNSSINLSGVLAAKITKRKLVVFIREDYFYDDQLKKSLLFKILARYSNLIICQSNRLADEIRQIGGKVEVFYDGVYEMGEPHLPSSPKEPQNFKIGIIGKIYHLKGQDVFIKAINRLKREGLPVKGVIYGSCRRFSANWSYLKKLKREGSVVFMDKVPPLDEIYNNLDVVVIASKSEGYSLIYPEALKYGKPVISTHTGVMEDVGKDGENILFFNYGDDRQLSNLIKKLYEDKELYLRLVQNGFNTYQAYFKEGLAAPRFMQMLLRAFNENRD